MKMRKFLYLYICGNYAQLHLSVSVPRMLFKETFKIFCKYNLKKGAFFKCNTINMLVKVVSFHLYQIFVSFFCSGEVHALINDWLI